MLFFFLLFYFFVVVFLFCLCWLGIFPIKVLIQSFCFSFFSLVFSVDPAPLLTDALREEIHTKLYDRFKWKNDGKCSWFLGCAVKPNANEITVDQCAYLETVLKSFEKYDVKLSNVPANTKLLSALTEDEPITDFPYSSLVGSLNWLMKTRPEISFAVSQCSRYLHNHVQCHDEAALKVLGYLKKNPNLGLYFPKSHFNKEELFVDAYADLSNVDCLDDRKSSYGYTLRANGRPLSWHSKKSPQVCLSSCKAEYYAMSECAQEIKFARNLLKDLELPSNDVIPM